MKVILASYSKCGTKTMNVALTHLGYNVYDILENFWYFEKEWAKILNDGTGDVETYRRMYEGVDAVVDLPTYLFWNEIHEAFPEAKIIIAIREEESWFESFNRQAYKIYSSLLMKLVLSLSPTGKRFYTFINLTTKYHFGKQRTSPWERPVPNKKKCIDRYRKHNEWVLKEAPKDKLLVFNVQDGWEPLCKFLNLDIPSIPFPHANVRGELFETWLKQHPFAIRMKREVIVIFIVAFVAFIVPILLYFIESIYF